MDDLETQFTEAMLGIYEQARDELGYNASYYLTMVQDRGGLDTAKHLLSQKVSQSYTYLFEKNRLDLSVEALILNKRWQPLFSADEIKKAKKRYP